MDKLYDPKDNQNAGTVGGAIAGSTIAGQTTGAINRILEAKGHTKRHPVLVPILGAGLGIAGILGGIKAGQKITEKKKKHLPIEDIPLRKELDKPKKKHGIRKSAMFDMIFKPVLPV